MIPTPMIQIRTEFWHIWGRIAVAEAAKASQARDRLGKTGVSADDNQAMDDEINAGVVAVCAAAFSIETLLRLLTPLVVDPATLTAWDRNETGFKPRLRETLRRSLAVGGPDADKLTNGFKHVIDGRGKAVHYIGKFEEPVPDPMGGRSSPVKVDYSKESAEKALAAMRNIYKALVEHPKPDVRALVSEQSRALNELAGLAPG